MTLKELYSQAVHDLTQEDRLRLAWMILHPNSEEMGSEDAAFAETGLQLAANLGTPGEFSDWESMSA